MPMWTGPNASDVDASVGSSDGRGGEKKGSALSIWLN
jgi:hypothetical protein